MLSSGGAQSGLGRDGGYVQSDSRFRSRGLMTQCVAALLRYLFEELKLHRVTIRCATGNKRSCAIPERLGFRQEGVELEAEWVGGRWVDLLNWGILEQEWRQSSSTAVPN